MLETNSFQISTRLRFCPLVVRRIHLRNVRYKNFGELISWVPICLWIYSEAKLYKLISSRTEGEWSEAQIEFVPPNILLGSELLFFVKTNFVARRSPTRVVVSNHMPLFELQDYPLRGVDDLLGSKINLSSGQPSAEASLVPSKK